MAEGKRVDTHKLNTPLTAIYGYIQLFELKAENLTATQKKWLKEMKKEAERLIGMIREL